MGVSGKWLYANPRRTGLKRQKQGRLNSETSDLQMSMDFISESSLGEGLLRPRPDGPFPLFVVKDFIFLIHPLSGFAMTFK